MTYNPAGGKTYTLGASISSTATSITLSSFALPVSGTLITMAVLNSDIAYGTIGPKTSSAEFISFTGITQNANGTATLTGVTRGLDKVSPFTTNATYKLPHSGQTLFILSDAPQVFAEYAAKRSANTFTEVQEFTLLPTSSGGNAVSGTQLVTYAQALAMATGTTNIDRIVVAGNGGEAITAGQLLYLLVTDGEWYKCDADTAATVDNIILGIAQGTGSNGVAITSGILLFGLDSNQTGLTNNTAYYASNTAGAISSTVGTVEVSVGISRSTTSLLFYPRYNQQLTEDQQDALVGTSGTPSASNKYVTNADTSGTGSVVRSSLLTTKFGGDGTDGALTITSGATNIDCAGAAFVIKNYTSISITGTGSLTFTNPNANGTTIILKSQGDTTLTSSATPMIDGRLMGATGGTAVTAAAATNGVAGTNSLGTIITVGGGGLAVPGVSVGTGGVAASLSFNPVQFLQTRQKYNLIYPGTGGAGGCLEGGGGSATTGAIGGRGGGALMIECAGAWNFTTANGINVSGQSPAAGADNGTNQVASAGAGGGSGGMFLALYNTLTANSGTVVVTGGTGGNNGSGSYAPNRRGGGGGGFLTAGNSGTSTAGASAKSGGDGATGYSVIAKNTEFA